MLSHYVYMEEIHLSQILQSTEGIHIHVHIHVHVHAHDVDKHTLEKKGANI